MAGKFEIFKSINQKFYFRLRAANNEPILRSEGYNTKSGCLNGIESVKKNAALDERYEIKISNSNNKHYFNLKAANGEVIATSEIYESSNGMQNGIVSVKINAPTAPVSDLT